MVSYVEQRRTEKKVKLKVIAGDPIKEKITFTFYIL